ncbi:aerolysin-like [Physella acuta]|uniref:aerolysin-like n=1 Tax=Physella acuta TaxID=109671 RepID=UPI0027DB2D12|nr:aerolysin-like [Physella acuta]
MDTTMSGMAKLANKLGYAWCGGCRSEAVGEDFRRDGDKWVADKSGRCEGYMSDKRLSMVYDDWSFVIKDITYGKAVDQDITTDSIDSGTVYNNHPTADTESVTRSYTSYRRVTHTTTSSWKNSHELNVQVTFTPFDLGGGLASYKFNYETSVTTFDANWTILMYTTKTSINYTATIIPKFSIDLQGFLRWGGGAENTYTNYHYQHRGSEARPTLNYKFGDHDVPFYKALKRQSVAGSLPWLWNDLTNAYTDVEYLINSLCNENQYTFTITGRFDDVIGKNVEVKWGAPTRRKR